MSQSHHSSLPRLFQSLRKGVTAFFQNDIALERAEAGVRIVLQPRQAAPRAPAAKDSAALREAQELALMRSQLAELLDALPETRRAMRHLVFVEQALARKGLRALHKLPLDVLQRGLEQFEGLVTNWSPEGLASLRSKMAVTIIDREHLDPDADADAGAAVPEATLMPGPEPQVTECSDDEALAAAYAALGTAAPGAVETQGELGSPSARAAARETARPAARSAQAPEAIRLRELHG